MLGGHDDLPGQFQWRAVEPNHWRSLCPTGTIRHRSGSERGFEDGQLEQMRAHPVDLVLLDIMMPDIDGYAVLEEMSIDFELRNIPVLMISAIEDIKSVVRCIELGRPII
jgi:DNA-binding NarL/FixJ family response regulator